MVVGGKVKKIHKGPKIRRRCNFCKIYEIFGTKKIMSLWNTAGNIHIVLYSLISYFFELELIFNFLNGDQPNFWSLVKFLHAFLSEVNFRKMISGLAGPRKRGSIFKVRPTFKVTTRKGKVDCILGSWKIIWHPGKICVAWR